MKLQHLHHTGATRASLKPKDDRICGRVVLTLREPVEEVAVVSLVNVDIAGVHVEVDVTRYRRKIRDEIVLSRGHRTVKATGTHTTAQVERNERKAEEGVH